MGRFQSHVQKRYFRLVWACRLVLAIRHPGPKGEVGQALAGEIAGFAQKGVTVPCGGATR